MLLGKGNNKFIEDEDNGMFKSECCYDWIRLKRISGVSGTIEDNFENLLVKSYESEINERQQIIQKMLHIQQGIIALPADDKEDEASYNAYLDELEKTGVVFVSFINIPSWSKKDVDNIQEFNDVENQTSVNEVVKTKILEVIDESSMRLFHTLDHNDFVLFCDGSKTVLSDYIKTLEEIKFLSLTESIYAVHDVTTIYGYKSEKNNGVDNSISAVVSVICNAN